MPVLAATSVSFDKSDKFRGSVVSSVGDESGGKGGGREDFNFQ